MREIAKGINAHELSGALNCRIDNTTVVSLINEKGGTRSWDCLMIAKEFVKKRNYLSLLHIFRGSSMLRQICSVDSLTNILSGFPSSCF